MKCSLAVLLAVIATVSAAALTEEQKHKADDHVQACTKEIGVTSEAVTKLRAGDFSEKNEKMQCLVKCVFQRAGFMNDKGEFQDKIAIEKLSKGDDKAKIEELVTKCKVTKTDKPCENAYAMYECYSKAKKSILVA